MKRLTNEFNFFDTKTSYKELSWETIVNFTWGFAANIMTPFIVANIQLGVLFGFLVNYYVISHILNRKKYVSKIGRYVILPIPATLGAFASYKLGRYIVTLLM